MKNKEFAKKVKDSVVAGAKLYQRYLELDEKAANIRAKIAKLAMETCEIHHGGRYNEIYTLTKFSDDIGMSSKTLTTWIQIYKMGLKIEISEPTDEEWSCLRRAVIIEKQSNSKFAKRIGAGRDGKSLKRDVIKEIITQKHRDRNSSTGAKYSGIKKNSESTSSTIRVSVGNFIRILDAQQVNLEKYKKGDLGVEELELLKNYVARMKKRFDQLIGDGE